MQKYQYLDSIVMLSGNLYPWYKLHQSNEPSLSLRSLLLWFSLSVLLQFYSQFRFRNFYNLPRSIGSSTCRRPASCQPEQKRCDFFHILPNHYAEDVYVSKSDLYSSHTTPRVRSTLQAFEPDRACRLPRHQVALSPLVLALIEYA
jgi:hypothetical protein